MTSIQIVQKDSRTAQKNNNKVGISMMHRKIYFVLTVFALLLMSQSVFAYFEEYPPFSFEQGAPKPFAVKSLIGNDQSEYQSAAGELKIKLKDESDAYSFLLQDGDRVLAKAEGDADFFADRVYQADLDQNGFADLVVFSSNRGAGLGAHFGVVDIYLKRSPTHYDAIRYESFGAGAEDVVDLDGNGKAEVIVGSFYAGAVHNYYAYSIYEIENGQLVNADAKHEGFPKFVLFTNERNDQNDLKLSAGEKTSHIQSVEARFTA